MTRDIKDIITDMREIVKPCIAQMLFNENFEGKGNTDKAEFETEFEMLLTLAERGATVEPQEWISVKDRLPELGQNVLVTYTDGDVETNERMALKGIVVWKYGSNVVAWMPLPSPYKGE
jgi:hypothetical protein